MDYSKFILLGLIAIAGNGNSIKISQKRTDVKKKVEGGEPICIDKAPYQVYLKDGGEYTCGGALIRPNIVLTAAHCVMDLDETLIIVAGTDSTKFKKDESRVKIRVEDYTIHPDFDSEDAIKYDIAVLKLSKDFPQTNKISPIKLTTVDVKEGDELLITGIGMTDKNSFSLSPCLKAYKPKVVNCENSLSSLKLPLNNYDGVICHKSPVGHRTHTGDSGSPMVNLQGQLVGIHSCSFGDEACQMGINVFYHSTWIKETIMLHTNEVLENF